MRASRGIWGWRTWYCITIRPRDVGGITTKAEEANETVVVTENAATRRSSKLWGDVVTCFTERRIITIDTDLLGQPERPRETVDGEVGRKPIHDIILVDRVRLPLIEKAGDYAERLVGGRRETQFL